jgi:hypothetical protein
MSSTTRTRTTPKTTRAQGAEEPSDQGPQPPADTSNPIPDMRLYQPALAHMSPEVLPEVKSLIGQYQGAYKWLQTIRDRCSQIAGALAACDASLRSGAGTEDEEIDLGRLAERRQRLMGEQTATEIAEQSALRGANEARLRLARGVVWAVNVSIDDLVERTRAFWAKRTYRGGLLAHYSESTRLTEAHQEEIATLQAQQQAEAAEAQGFVEIEYTLRQAKAKAEGTIQDLAPSGRVN